jgi:hypothetical protein
MANLAVTQSQIADRSAAFDDQTMQRHILSTYNSLRFGMGVMAAVTPVIIVLWGYGFHINWQDSISAYYFAPSGNQWVYSAYPCRVFFVGTLFALESFLYLYKGFSKREDWALNTAGVCAVTLAVFPMYAETGYIPLSNYVHFGAAVILFLCMAYAAIFCSQDTLQLIADASLRSRYRVLYHVVGWFMALFPVVGLIVAMSFSAAQRETFWIEAAGIWAFAAYWFIKSNELKTSEADLKAVTGTLRQSS